MTPPVPLPRALLLSIRPKYTQLILAEKKTIELRKQRPRLDPGDLVVMYASAPVCALVGAFELRGILSLRPSELWAEHGAHTGVSKQDFERYYRGRDQAYGLLVGQVLPLEDVVGLSTLRKQWTKFHPPQSYRYLQLEQTKNSLRLEFADRVTTVSLERAG